MRLVTKLSTLSLTLNDETKKWVTKGCLQTVQWILWAVSIYFFINEFRFKERFHSPNNEFGGRLKCVQFIFVKYILCLWGSIAIFLHIQLCIKSTWNKCITLINLLESLRFWSCSWKMFMPVLDRDQQRVQYSEYPKVGTCNSDCYSSVQGVSKSL